MTGVKKIFISHSNADSLIGEKLVDVLVDMGIDKEDIFYTSLYYTGVELGKNFPLEVKNNKTIALSQHTPRYWS